MKNLGVWFVVVLLLSTMSGCRSTRYVPVERVRNDTVYLHKVERDSVYRRDSIHVRDKGDTVYVEKFRYLFADRWRTDTVYVNRRDSVQVPYPVERELTRWERVKMDVGGVAIGSIVVVILIVVGYMVYRLKKR